MTSSPPTPRIDAPRNCSGLGVDEDLHEALRLALLEGAADILHGHLGHRAPADRIAHLRLGQPDAAERRIGVQVVGDDAVADPARIVVEQVGGDDLEVVVGGVREGAPAVAVAQRPDAGDAGAQLIVDLDEAALVDGDAGLVEAEVVGVRAGGRPRAAGASRSTSRRAAGSLQADRDVLARAWRLSGLVDAHVNVDAFGLQDVRDRGGDVLVLARRSGAAPSRSR